MSDALAARAMESANVEAADPKARRRDTGMSERLDLEHMPSL
jgi:hypothetical protein